jgi:hypothetical protein
LICIDSAYQIFGYRSHRAVVVEEADRVDDSLAETACTLGAKPRQVL